MTKQETTTLKEIMKTTRWFLKFGWVSVQFYSAYFLIDNHPWLIQLGAKMAIKGAFITICHKVVDIWHSLPFTG